MGHGRSGERQRTTCQEAFLPAVVASLSQHQPKSGVLAVHHYLVQTQSYVSQRLWPGLVQSADLSQDPEQVICLLNYNEGVDKMIHTILY